MRYLANNEETILAASVTTIEQYKQLNKIENGLLILWNVGTSCTLVLDGRKVEMENNCITFVTEFHKIEALEFERLNIIQFNRPFYCIEEHDHETGCKGILWYSTTSIPKFVIPEEKQKQFDTLWDTLQFEIEEEENDNLKLDMLRIIVKRLIILSLRIYKKESKDIPTSDSGVALVREFNYLVEVNFKELTKVQDYAKLLYKSPKTISNTFKKFTDKTPLRLINERRIREAKFQLKNTDYTIQEISDTLNFNDVQAFSNFFKKFEKMPPTLYRSKHATTKFSFPN